MPVQVHSTFFVHPGIWLRQELVEPRNITVGGLAGFLHVTRQALSALLNGRAGLSAEMAIRFEKAFGIKADTLIRMQAAHDLASAREHEGGIEVERLPELV